MRMQAGQVVDKVKGWDRVDRAQPNIFVVCLRSCNYVPSTYTKQQLRLLRPYFFI